MYFILAIVTAAVKARASLYGFDARMVSILERRPEHCEALGRTETTR